MKYEIDQYKELQGGPIRKQYEGLIRIPRQILYVLIHNVSLMILRCQEKFVR